MPKGGQFVIQTSLEDIDAAYVQRQPEGRVGQFICLTMTDSGCGMDHVTLGRLFEPFFTTKEFGKGTGLGLATVYGIVKRHQGWIDVQSQIGRGSAFRIYFPPMDRAAESAAAKPGDAVSGGQETVLVVEDEAPVLRIMKSVLERYGYRVLEAANGVEALGVWHSHQNDIAVLLTDMVMPVGLSGQELADKFKALKPNLRVIYTSGYSVEVAGKNLSLMEGLNFLQKPFDSEKLALAVRRCLDN
jgi:CheY-like chemotaxis protein